jgi:acetyl-CoA carboxylase carboxyl transferase subunit alpha
MSFEEKSQSSVSEQITKAWQVVERSRHSQRPYTLDYISRLFEDYEELRGDRHFSEDPALVCGVGILKEKSKSHSERSVFFMGQQKGRDTKQRIERNFGMAKPEGYRKAMRVMEMAERFNKPLLTFIDTPGAYPGVGAEERGQSEAIAQSILKMFKMRVPSVAIVIGEGGSGGALAIGVADRLLMLENSTYSVISPESCAAILWGHAGESKRAAWALRLSAPEIKRLGVCDEVIPESGAGAHETFEELCQRLAKVIEDSFSELEAMGTAEMMRRRFEKYRALGQPGQ